MSQKNRKFNPKLARVRIYNLGGGKRIIFRGYSAKNLARSRKKLHSKSPAERAKLQKAMAAHKTELIAAGYSPKKYINIPDD